MASLLRIRAMLSDLDVEDGENLGLPSQPLV
jgi:hypothetical protein